MTAPPPRGSLERPAGRTRLGSAAIPTHDPAFAQIKALIVAETGHHYYEDKDDQLWERIARRMAATGVASAALYLDRLRDEATGPREWRLLEGELTIKETFFFRFAEQFAALRTAILPALIDARAETRRLRLWSAGCSTGAEPYSLAVIVRELLGDALGEWQVSILGTDIDEAALAAALEARYGDWSLRTMPPAERARLFAADGDRWRLRPDYRAMVRFERLNILDLLGPAPPLQLTDFDLILCRNMLIYFRPDTATRLVGAMGARMAADGWLLLGHAEAGLAVGSGIDGAEIGGVIAYRHPAPDRMPATEAPPPPAPSRSPPRRAGTPRTTRPASAAAAPMRRAPAGASPSIDPLAEVRRLLDAGDTAAAGDLIARLRANGGGDARLLYLDAIRLLADDDRPAATRALRGALYLDGGFAMAHYLLGRTLEAAGRRQEARRAFANVIGALAAADPDDAVPEGDGRTASALRAIVQAELAKGSGR